MFSGKRLSLLRLYCTSKLFLTLATLKLVFGCFYASSFLESLFIPFVRSFVLSGFQNPWDAYFQQNILNAFPYSSGMLAILTIPYSLAYTLWGHVPPHAIELFSFRLPLFFSDLVIYLLLCKWFETRWKDVLKLYWCSPIIFFICYIHGQLDIIPTAFLLLSLWYTTKMSPIRAGLFLAIGLSTKFHLAAALPLIVIHFWKGSRRDLRIKTVLQFLTVIGAGVMVLIFPLMHSEGYRMLVLNAKETGWIYETAWALPLGVKLLFCPAAVLALIFHFLTYEKITKDVLILYSGLLYTLLIILVPPMPGWAAWSIPFIVYFLIRHQITRFYPYWIYNFSYFIYYVVFAPSVAYAIFQPYTLTLPHARDIVFTIMQTSVVLTAAWIYMIGVKSFVQYKLLQKVRVIGIGGDSSSGKHTLAETITHLVGTFNSVRLHGDDYHRWPRGHEAWKSLTHLDPRSNYFREPLEHIQELRKGASITRTSYDHTEGKFLEPTTIHSNRYIIFEGLHPFVFQRLRDVFDIKILLSTNEELRRHWKIERDTRLRGHARQQVLSEINRRSEDAKKFIQPQENFADWVIEYSPIQPKKFDRLKVAHRISSNVVEIEELVERLSQVDSLKVEWHMEPKLTHQRLEIEGHIPATTVRQIATALFPDFYDLMDPSAHWHADLQGINQLIFIAVFKGLQKPS